MKAATRKHYAVKSFDQHITFRYPPYIIRRMREFPDSRLKDMGFSPASVTRAARKLRRDEEAAAQRSAPAPVLAALAAFQAGYGD